MIFKVLSNPYHSMILKVNLHIRLKKLRKKMYPKNLNWTSYFLKYYISLFGFLGSQSTLVKMCIRLREKVIFKVPSNPYHSVIL